MKIAYFVHDLNDSVVRRRLDMLKSGGAEVVLLGFRRGDRAAVAHPDLPVIEFGLTFPLSFVHRLLSVARQAFGSFRWRQLVHDVDVVIARNLDQLMLAAASRWLWARKSRLVYECLDIHDLMLDGGLKGRLVRGIERLLLRSCSQVIVSSPSYTSYYFESRQGSSTPTLLIENKVLGADPGERGGSLKLNPPPLAPPWRIGYFGNVRCAKSVTQMVELVRRCNGLLEISIWGVPVRHELENFDELVQSSKHITYHGPYESRDLPEVYSRSHFTWTIDYFQEGRNSAWLLPNRLYEGSALGCVPIGLRDVEIGRWMSRHGVGVLFDDVLRELPGFLGSLTAEQYAELRADVLQLPRSVMVADAAECSSIVKALVLP